MPIPSIYSTLLERIGERTDAGQVYWQPTTDATTFVVHLKKWSLTIDRFIPQESYDNDQLVIRVVIQSSVGKELDSFHIVEGESGFQELDILYASARYGALKIEDAVKEILEEIEGDSDIGFPF